MLEEARGEGKAAGVEEAGPGRGCQVGGGCRWRGKDGEVEIVRWRWRGGRNHRIMCEEWRHPGSGKIYGKTTTFIRKEVSLLIGPDTTFIRKASVFAYRAHTTTFIRMGSVFANRAGLGWGGNGLI